MGIPKIISVIGVDNVTFETDYPHTDSTWPNTKAVAEKLLEGLPAEVVYKVLRGNALTMLGRTEGSPRAAD